MSRTDPTHLVVGHLTRPHGTRGEFFVTMLTDHPERMFAPGVVLFLGGEDDDEPDPDLPPLRVAGTRQTSKGLLVTFGGVSDRSQAEVLRGRYLFAPIDAVAPLEDGEVFYHQVLGLEVRTTDGTRVGQVHQIYELEPVDLLEVQDGDRTLMIPWRPEIVVEIDVGDGRLTIDPPDGLLEL